MSTDEAKEGTYEVVSAPSEDQDAGDECEDGPLKAESGKQALNAGACCSSSTSNKILPSSEPIHMTLEEVRNSLSSTLIGTSRTQGGAEEPRTARSNALKNCFRRTLSALSSIGSHDRDAGKGAVQKKNRRKSFPSLLKHQLRNFFGMKKSQSADSAVLSINILRSRIGEYQGEGLFYYPEASDVCRILPTNSNLNVAGRIYNLEYDSPSHEFRGLGVEMTEGVFIGDRDPTGFVEFSASLERVKDVSFILVFLSINIGHPASGAESNHPMHGDDRHHLTSSG